MRIIIAALAAMLMLQTSFAAAATPGEPAYRKVVFSANYPWSEGLSLNLEVDEARCRAKYGSRWREKCAASIGRPGDTVKGVSLKPSAKGYWQWNSGTSMIFIPENPQSIQPDTLYAADLGGLYHPSAIMLDKTGASLRTPPLSANLLDFNFWIDPSPASRHRLAASMEFNYPVPQNSAEISLLPLAGAKFGKAEMVWSPNRDRLNISWPVKKLPEARAQAAVMLKDFWQVSLKDGQAMYWPPAKNGELLFKKNIPAADALFGIKKMELEPALDENLNRVHVLVLETSLYARPEDVLANLGAWQLPKFNSAEAGEPCDWKMAPAIPPSALEKGKKLLLEPMEKDKSPRTVFKFRAPVENDRYLLVLLKDDLHSASGQKLRRPWAEIAQAKGGSASLDFLQPGNILPLREDGRLDLYATDLDSIKWEVQLARDPFLALVAESSDAPFERPLSQLGMGMEAFSDSASGKIALARTGQGKAQFASLDLAAVLRQISKTSGGGSASGLARVNLVGLRDGKEKAWTSRMVLPTNLGIMVKRGALGEYDCFVQNLNEGKPAAGAKISILGVNGRPVASARANGDGHARFPSLTGIKRESAPVAAVAELDGQLAWLPLGDKSRELNYSNFSTGGAHAAPDGLNAYVFGQRGIYRPGDTLHFGCIVRRADFASLPANMPLYAELRDPRGVKMREMKFEAGEFGLAELNWPIPETALSGRYILNVLTGKNGESIGAASARVEEFQPDTLKMKIDVPQIAGWLHAGQSANAKEGPEIRMFLQNLYGSPAAGHKIRARLETLPASFRFPEYAEYVFTDSSPFRGDGQKRNMPEMMTDANGGANLAIPADLLGGASARLLVSAEGFELGGGRASGAQASFLVSPMPLILGYKPVGALTNMRFIPQGQKAELKFLALDPQLKKSPWDGVEFSLAHRRYVTSLVSDGQGGFRYDETPIDAPIKTWKADITADGLVQPLDTDMAGEFLLTARNGKGEIIARVPYAVAGERLDPPDAPLAGGKMRLRLDKDSYKAGDVINFSLALPYDGAGLASLERDGVAAFAWFKARAGESRHQIKIPEDFEGKGYLVVSFVRSTESPAIYMSPHTYAVAPFSANISKRDMKLRVEAPQKAAPGEKLEVKLSADEPGKAILFAVDEGILQLTNFQRPAPLAGLLANRALDVSTLQAFDLLMPDHARLAPRLSAFGGGMEGGVFGKRFQNPFKRKNEPPVASWSAIVPVGPEPLALSIPIPDYYNGQLRIMAVGIGAESAGASQAQTHTAAPLVLSPAMPLTVAPGDFFKGGLALANTTEADAKVNLRVESGKSLKFVNMPEENLTIAAGGEIMLPFSLQALDEPGPAEIVFTAEMDGKTYKRKSYLSLRPASPMRSSLLGGLASKSADLPVERKLYPQFASSRAMISALPIPLAAGFAQYLDTYPHGCSEQLISRAFAQTLLRAWPIFSGDEKARKKLLDSTLATLNSRYDGQGISLWPNAQADPLATVYAADFLLALREAGIGGGDDLLSLLCDALESNCALNDSSLEAARTSAYAIWVLTREGRITTQLLENLQDSLRERNIAGWQNDITAALMAASGKEMHMRQAKPPQKIVYSGQGMFDEFAQYALHMAILARYFPELIDGGVRKNFYETAGLAMKENSFATFSANQGIRALLALAGNAAPDILEAKLYCADNAEGGSGELLANGALFQYKINQCGKFALDIPANSPDVFWQISTSGYDLSPTREKAAHGIEIEREYLDEEGRPVKSVEQGDVVIARIRARAMENEIKDCVITDLLPGGFEMVIKKENGAPAMPDGLKYLDRQEDRMLLFADLANKPMEFSYLIRATAAGIFTVPPVAAEAMYNQALYGHGAAGKIEIRD